MCDLIFIVWILWELTIFIFWLLGLLSRAALQAAMSTFIPHLVLARDSTAIILLGIADLLSLFGPSTVLLLSNLQSCGLCDVLVCLIVVFKSFLS